MQIVHVETCGAEGMTCERRLYEAAGGAMTVAAEYIFRTIRRWPLIRSAPGLRVRPANRWHQKMQLAAISVGRCYSHSGMKINEKYEDLRIKYEELCQDSRCIKRRMNDEIQSQIIYSVIDECNTLK
ncbi:unnamed protein product [Cuscuta epithymum]|uniref:Uncharacterized protein n=1 Tax=Cuscuta epithymum TaxID=186058 RepID=A0AAV0CQP8_9ASTE|nr:unnamed protein product [Cuscuta epithymum]